MKKKLILIDVLAVLYRSYYAIPDLTTQSGTPTGALYGVALTLIKIIKQFSPEYIIACYDLPKPTHRHEEYEGYKQSREIPEDDLIEQIEESRRLFETFGIPIKQKEGFEADDVIGTFSEKLKNDVDVIIITGDKDLLQLVDGEIVKVFLLKRGIKETLLLNEKAAEEHIGFPVRFLIDFKGLKGDPSDEIPGVRGIGDKRASALINKIGTIEQIYNEIKTDKDAVKAYGFSENIVKKLEDGEKDAIMSKQLATIHTDVPITINLPEQELLQSIKPSLILNYLTKFEFTTLIQQANEILSNSNEGTEVEESSELLKKASIAYWILDSEKTEVSRDEILATTRSRTIEESLEKLLKQIRDEGTIFVWEAIEEPLISVIDEMETAGIKIDTNHLAVLFEEYQKRINGIEKKIIDIAGEEFNVSSSKQLGGILFDKMNLTAKGKTSKGARSTKESELLKIKNENPIVALVLEHRKLRKLVTTYIEPLPKLKDKNSRIHSNFLQNGTTTGRMSSNSPNMQNIPKHTKDGIRVRNAFISGSGMSFIAFDYSQMELRLAAILSKDKNLLDIFRDCGDVHKNVAAQIFKVDLDKVTDKMRGRAKTINFGVIYGMGVRSLSQSLEISTTEAKDFLQEYKETFPAIYFFFEGVKKMARDKGYVETMFGRRRIIHGINSRLPSIRSRAERTAINAPVQGTGADVIKIAMIKISKYLENKTTNLILQVHDELLFEVRDDEIKQIIKDILPLMEENIFKQTLEIPIKVDVSVGKKWGELEKIS